MGYHLNEFDFHFDNIANVFCVLGNDLRVCPKDNGKQCCSQRMEDRFAVLARGDFDEAMSSKVGEMKSLFNEQAKAFDGRLFAKKNVQSVKRVWIKTESENSAKRNSFGMC